ncbi:tRNA (adenosine(37)-N6)-threonylcarbamoyltransferase complex ATPase subunit type 1 TsaE [Compostibacter hankyongensis]|uniref:tRNA threonylcarbamoyladenosine biosynthesis protein TsaE n=1 Tax=Compostibacter hankyongensis TaxID=1007089 RepID=A0ABP8FGV1_9BACT
MEITFDLEGLPAAARELWQQHPDARVFAFYGPMGAGKTTFIKALCRIKNVEDATSSPTFSLINEYGYTETGGEARRLYHMDLYRLRDEAEAIQAGVEDCLYSGSICLVEWPEHAAALLPDDTVAVSLSVLPDQRRLLRTTRLTAGKTGR